MQDISLWQEPHIVQQHAVDELPTIKDAINFTMAVCQFDATPFRQHAQAYVAKYSGLEFGEEDVKAVKKIVAELNKKSKDFNEIRLDIKREFNKPLNSFEDEINSVSEVYKQAVMVLKSKLDVYEQKYRAQKVQQINELIKSVVVEYKLNETYAATIDVADKYLNQTETMAKIKKDLAARAHQAFIHQENERLVEVAEAERLQRRITMLNELNANYAGRIAREVNYVDVARMTDDEVYTMFTNMARLEELRVTRLEERRVRDEEIERNIYPFPATCDLLKDPNAVTDDQLKEMNKEVHELIDRVWAEPTVKHRYICDISTTATEDTILPWLKKMKEHGIITFVHKKLEE